MAYDVANPHPGFGKDPNILNELGHTKYPMMVTVGTDDKGKPIQVQCANEKEEKEALSKYEANKPSKEGDNWPKKK